MAPPTAHIPEDTADSSCASVIGGGSAAKTTGGLCGLHGGGGATGAAHVAAAYWTGCCGDDAGFAQLATHATARTRPPDDRALMLRA